MNARPDTPPTVGLLLSTQQNDVPVADVLQRARQADKHGLDIWITQQLIPRPGHDWGKTAPETFGMLGALSQITGPGCRIGIMVLAAPYLPQYYLAKCLVTIDQLCGGRLDVGLGAGWKDLEFEMLGLEKGPLRRRIAYLEDTLDIIGEVCRGETVHVRPYRPTKLAKGKVIEVPPMGPVAVQQPTPPVWIGGESEAILRVVAERATWGNLARGISLESFAHKTKQVSAFAGTLGREDAVRMSLTATFLTGVKDEVQDALARRAKRQEVSEAAYARRLREMNVFVGTHEQMAEQMVEFASAGCEAFVLWPLDPTDAVKAPRDLQLVKKALADACG